MKLSGKKIISLFLSVVIIMSAMFLLASCSQSKKTVYELIAEDEPQQSLALIVNYPKEDVISKVEINKSLTLGEDGDRILVIPKYENSVLEIYSITSENGSFLPVEQVYVNNSTQKDFVLDLSVIRSDSNPQFKIVIKTPTDFAEYILFAPKGGDGSFEYVISDLGKLTKADTFKPEEVGYIFSKGKEYIKGIYGEPTKSETLDYYGDETATRLTFDENVFEIEDEFDSIYLASVTDDKMQHPRGIKMGDSLPMVLSKFPNFSDGDTKNFEENDKYEGEYEMLYGEYMHMQSYGFIHYVDDIVTEVVYSNQGVLLVFSFNNNRVSGITCSVAG